MRTKTGIWAVIVGGVFAASAALGAQNGTSLDVKMMSFSLWCQETQHYAFERCEARTAEDLRDFEIYRTTVENYEVDYLRNREQDNALEQRLLKPGFGAPDSTRVPGSLLPY